MKEWISILQTVWRIDEAVQGVQKHLVKSDKQATKPLSEALGSIVAEDVYSPCHVPHFRRSTMDGYATIASYTHGASDSMPSILHLGNPDYPLGSRVYTGEAVPESFDSVVMLEYVEELGDGTLLVSRPVATGENVMSVGEDIMAGRQVISQGQQIAPRHIALLAALGVIKVKTREFQVGVISTGNEIVSASSIPGLGQMRDINAPFLLNLFRQAGYQVTDGGIVRDDLDDLTRSMQLALAQGDAVVLSGGSSAGAVDHTERVIRNLGLPGVLVHGLAVRPGKPTVIGVVNGKLVLGLPGHPLSCAIMAEIIALPLLRFAAQASAPRLLHQEAVLSRALVSAPGRRDFVPVRLEGHQAVPLQAKSAAIQVLAQSDGLLVVPEECEGYNAGTLVKIQLWRQM